MTDSELSLGDNRSLLLKFRSANKLCYDAKKMEFIIRGGQHKVRFPRCCHIESRIEQANFQA